MADFENETPRENDDEQSAGDESLIGVPDDLFDSGGESVVVDPVEPGSPTLENAAFVLLGVLVTVGLFVHLLLITF